MFTSCGYDLVKCDGKIGYEDYSEKDQKLMEQILTLSGIADHQLFQIYQIFLSNITKHIYFFIAK